MFQGSMLIAVTQNIQASRVAITILIVFIPRGHTSYNHIQVPHMTYIVHHSVDNEDLTSASHHDSGECSTSDQRPADADLPVAIGKCL